MKKNLSALLISLWFTMQICYGAMVTIIEKDISYSFTQSAGTEVTIEAVDPEIEGWNVKSGEIIIDENNSFIMPENNVEIEAEYEEPTEYLLTLNIFGQTTREMKNVGESVTVSLPENSNYKFISWNATGIELTEDEKIANEITFEMPNKKVTLATSHKIKYIISYDANGGDGAPEAEEKLQGESLTLSNTEPTREGHNFLGWAITNNAVTPTYQPGGTFELNSNAILYAVWESNTYTIRYNANGGTGEISPLEIAIGGSGILTKNTFQKAGHTFAGWALTADGEVEYQDEEEILPTADMILYAVWLPGGAVQVPTLAAQGTWYIGRTSIPKSSITSIYIEDSYTPVGTVVASWDASAIDSEGTVTAYVEEVGADNYKLTLAGNGTGKIYANSNSYNMFGSFSNVTAINGFNDESGVVLDTSNVTNMAYMFNNCENLTTLDVSKFDTSNVTNMAYMFSYCRNLTTLDVSKFDTSNVTNMTYMFNGCENLTTLDVSKFDTSNVTNMASMFYGCRSLTTLDVSKFDTSNVTSMNSMFLRCNYLTTLDVSKFDTSNVTNMASMFVNCNALTTLDVSNFDTGNVTNMAYMFSYCENLTTLDVSKFDTSNVTNMTYMFNGCENLTTLDVSNFDTSNVTNMTYMFSNCSNLTNLDLSNFDTSNVTDMSSMFDMNENLTTLDVSKFDTSNVINMVRMFNLCENLTTLDVSNFDTSNVTNMASMFNLCENLATLDLSNFDTSNVTSMNSMFQYCSNLTTLDVSNFDTSNVTSMNSMFQYCSNLTTLNISSFNTISIASSENLVYFASECTALTTIILGENFIQDKNMSTGLFSVRSSTSTTVTGANSVMQNYNWEADNRIVQTITSYTLTYDANGGENAPNSQTKLPGTPLGITPNEPVRSAYDFDSWNTELDGSGVAYYAGDEYEIDADETLYAQWVPIVRTLSVQPSGETYEGALGGTQEVTAGTGSTYTITYNYNGNGQANTTEDITLEFTEWTLTGEGSISGTTTATTTYTFGAGDGILKANYAGYPNLPTPTRTGYVFGGWATGTGEEAEIIGNTYIPTEDITLFATWDLEEVIVNAPELGYGMIPVNWNGTAWEDTIETEWDYNYNIATANTGTVAGDGTAKWANARTTDGSMWVWIPRYSYKIESGYHQAVKSWSSDLVDGTEETLGKILVKFSNETEDYTEEGYISHPAFTFGTDDLRGIWVAKYEMSSKDATESSVGTGTVIQSKPGVAPLTSISASIRYEKSKAYNRNLDSHMIRNSEWGAVAYLTNAIGRIPYNNNTQITGNSGTTMNITEDTTVKNSWNTENGVKASTTHNIYGIYDLAGGVGEVVAAYQTAASATYLANDVTNKTYGGSLYADRNTKYVEVYETNYGSGNLGDSMYETSSSNTDNHGWDDDRSYPPNGTNSAVYIRGGSLSSTYGTANQGIYSFGGTTGGAATTSGFRVVLTGMPERIAVNDPLLGEGMTPVNWNGRSWVDTTEDDWDYNYLTATANHGTVEGDGTAKWANARTEDGSMWVWIPRYTYKIESGNHQAVKSWSSDLVDGTETTLGKIAVKFSNGTTDDTTGSYIKHPAFTLGTTQLTGIWVSKYEISMEQDGVNIDPTTQDIGDVFTSSSIKAVSKPGAYSWRNIMISKSFKNAYNYNRDLDSHLIKNIEWGAVAYLTNAVGRIPYNNNSSSYITGNAGGSQDAEAAEGVTNAWNTVGGVKASSTHNVYGVYDLVGGTSENVAAYISNASSEYLAPDVGVDEYAGSLYEAVNNGRSQYVDVYSSPYSSSNKGDGMYETSSQHADPYNFGWDGDRMNTPKSPTPIFDRGGHAASGATGGLFRSNNGYGTGFSRIILAVTSEAEEEQEQITASISTSLLSNVNIDYSVSSSNFNPSGLDSGKIVVRKGDSIKLRVDTNSSTIKWTANNSNVTLTNATTNTVTIKGTKAGSVTITANVGNGVTVSKSIFIYNAAVRAGTFKKYTDKARDNSQTPAVAYRTYMALETVSGYSSTLKCKEYVKGGGKSSNSNPKGLYLTNYYKKGGKYNGITTNANSGWDNYECWIFSSTL